MIIPAGHWSVCGKIVPAEKVLCYDEAGRRLRCVTWVKPDEGTFGQLLMGEDGSVSSDPDHPGRPWEIVRFGKVKIEVLP